MNAWAVLHIQQKRELLRAKLDGQLDEDVKEHRADIIMQEQMFISDRFNEKLLGKRYRGRC